MSYDILRIDPADRVSLKVRNLSVAVGKQKKTDEEKSRDKQYILNDLSFDLESNEMLAIMGGSGSGKTTLLNTLSQRLTVSNKKLDFSGSINYYKNTALVSDAKQHIKNSYLLQTDVFPPGLTTMEYLMFHADLKLKNVSKQEKLQLIGRLLAILEIEHLGNEIITTFTGVCSFSGGERRRVSLAVQLLNRPSILFLDEPTTGLDTSSSLKLIQTLRKLSSSDLGVAVILSIHQPRPEISVLFDKMCLLTRGGRLVYYGNLVYSYDYFKTLNLLPQDIHSSQMVDLIMNLSVKDTSSRENEAKTIAKIDQLVNSWKSSHSLEDVPKVEFGTNLKIFTVPRSESNSLLFEISVLTRRVFLTSYRDVYGLGSLIGLSVFLAVVCGWMFYKPPADLAGIRSYTSCLYVALEVIGFVPLFIEIERLWQYDGVLFFREYTENYVSIPGFIISRKLGKLLLEDLPVTFAYSFITYFMFGLRLSEDLDGPAEWHYFWIYLAVVVVVYSCGIAMALACFSVSSDFPICAMVQNIFYQLQNSACGYFVNAATMPVYVRWLKYICYFWYAFGALSANQYTNWEGDCPFDTEDQCIEYTGNYQLSVLGFPKDWIVEPMWILVAWIVGFYLMAAVGLRFRNYDVAMAKHKENTIGEEEEEEHQQQPELDEKKAVTAEHFGNEFDNELSQDINIDLDRLSLTALSGLVSLKKTQFKILDNVTASFQANKLNVIMGPSGSGKTTLLNLISDRLPKSTRFKVEGTLLLNGSQTIKFSDLRKISGYVSQYDNSLIPHLTVRETFYYQAFLRLPLIEHDRIPIIINTLIRQMGLADCADMLIGDEFLKGVSGGERRRVSIGVQLLSKPKILFLDEPTSGLDSTTSVSILTLLENLTKESGTTIIATIHQPSEQIFQRFGDLLLLARGGHVIYNGKSSEIEGYLSSINFHKSHEVNIADYILDIISQGIDEDGETASLRINHLIQEWRINGMINKVEGSSVNLSDFKRTKLPFMTRFRTIFRRQTLSSFRSRNAFITRATQVIALGIIHALFFSPLRNTREGIDNRLGVIQEVLNFYFIGFINNFAIFPIERDLFYQEFKDGIYNNFEFQAVYFIIESAIELITCTIFSVFIVFIVGLPRTAGMYFSMLLTSFVSVNCGESLGIMVNAIFNHLGLAINILASMMTLAIFMGGTMSLHMPEFFKAWNFINPMKYAVGICAELAFRGQQFVCPAIGCELDSGDKVLEYYNLESYLPGFFGGLVACFIIYRILSLVVLEVKIRYML